MLVLGLNDARKNGSLTINNNKKRKDSEMLGMNKGKDDPGIRDLQYILGKACKASVDLRDTEISRG